MYLNPDRRWVAILAELEIDIVPPEKNQRDSSRLNEIWKHQRTTLPLPFTEDIGRHRDANVQGS